MSRGDAPGSPYPRRRLPTRSCWASCPLAPRRGVEPYGLGRGRICGCAWNPFALSAWCTDSGLTPYSSAARSCGGEFRPRVSHLVGKLFSSSTHVSLNQDSRRPGVSRVLNHVGEALRASPLVVRLSSPCPWLDSRPGSWPRPTLLTAPNRVGFNTPLASAEETPPGSEPVKGPAVCAIDVRSSVPHRILVNSLSRTGP